MGFLSGIDFQRNKIFFPQFLGHWLVAIRILLWPLRAPIPCGQERRKLPDARLLQ